MLAVDSPGVSHHPSDGPRPPSTCREKTNVGAGRIKSLGRDECKDGEVKERCYRVHTRVRRERWWWALPLRSGPS